MASDIRRFLSGLVSLGLERDAASGIERVLVEHQDNPDAWTELAASFRRNGRYEAAVLTYQTAERRFPMMEQIPNNRGIALREAGYLEEALQAFEQALRLKPDYGNALESKGNLLEVLERFEQGEATYRTLVELEPHRATAWNNLGNCLHQRGQDGEAARCYERAIELDPGYVFPLVNLAGLLDARGDRAAALHLLDRALAIAPDDGEALELKRRIDAGQPAVRLLPPAWTMPEHADWQGAAEQLGDRLERQEREARIVPELLRRSKELTDRQGFMAWSAERLQAEPEGDPGPQVVRLPPPTPEAPRLFVGYAWAPDRSAFDDREVYGDDIMTYAIAGRLFSNGHRIVFDRDPRNLDKGMSEIDVLRRLYDCNYFVPVVTERYVQRVAPDHPARGMVGAEWDLACQLADAGFLVFAGIWLSGDRLPPRLHPGNTADVRRDDCFDPELAKAFPPARRGGVGVPWIAAPVRPTEPEDWPRYDRPRQVAKGRRAARRGSRA